MRYLASERGIEGRVQPDLMGLGLKMAAHPAGIAGPLVHEVQVDDALLHLAIEHGELRVGRGAAHRPEIRLSGEWQAWGAVVSGAARLTRVVQSGASSVEGNLERLPVLDALYSGP